jgi:hypothetical protein
MMQLLALMAYSQLQPDGPDYDAFRRLQPNPLDIAPLLWIPRLSLVFSR